MENKNAYLATADVGGTTVKLGFFTMEGELIRKWEIKTDTSENGKNILADICKSVTEEAGDVPVYGMGMAVPGAVDEQGFVPGCVNLGWGAVDLPKEVGKLLPNTKVLKFGNDATIAALGELWKGAAGAYDSAYLATLGTGVGGGYAGRGGVINGAHGAAAEIGHITLNIHETVKCTCGKCGCVEQYVSANGIVRLAKNLLEVKSGVRTEGTLHIERMIDLEIPEGETPLAAMEKFTSKDICDLAAQGDAFSAYVVEIWGELTGLALSHVSCAVDPATFVLGGGMSKAGKILTDAAKKAFQKYAFFPARDTDIIIAQLGNDAGIYGCAKMLLG